MSFQGQEVTATGDGFFVGFDSPDAGPRLRRGDPASSCRAATAAWFRAARPHRRARGRRDVPGHRFTAALTWQIPLGRDRHFGSSMPSALDYVVGGWQYTVSNRSYSGRPLLFGNYLVTGNPKVGNPTRDRWFDTSMFAVADSYTPRSNPYYYEGLNGPGWSITDMTLTKMFRLNGNNRIEARFEAYNAFNQIIWDNPDLTLASANFGKVTRKRVDGNGREIQVGLRFIF